MSKVVFVIGPSGAGKTSAGRTLDPKSTFIFSALGKELPWKGSAKQYTFWDKTKNPEGNVLRTSQAAVVMKWLDYINTDMPHIKDIVIDDNTFITSLELLRRSKETDWGKFNDIANNFVALASKANSLRDDIVVYILHHTQSEGDGILEEKSLRAMSYGKLIDEKLGTQEAFFTTVLRAAKEKGDNGIEYVFYTRDLNSTAKAPFGMFDDEKIPNDLAAIRKSLECFYDDNCN